MAKTFVKITNEMIYKEIKELKEHVLSTNGKVKLNKWIATTALTLVIALSGTLVTIKYW